MPTSKQPGHDQHTQTKQQSSEQTDTTKQEAELPSVSCPESSHKTANSFQVLAFLGPNRSNFPTEKSTPKKCRHPLRWGPILLSTKRSQAPRSNQPDVEANFLFNTKESRSEAKTTFSLAYFLLTGAEPTPHVEKPSSRSSSVAFRKR